MAGAETDNSKVRTQRPTERRMIEMTLPTMTCGHCVKTVTQTVQRVDARARLEIELAQHRVRIESTHAENEFKTALAEAGYAQG